MAIALIRHGATVLNETGRLQGRSDLGLSTSGAMQIQRIAEGVNRGATHKIYASPLRRSVQTAEIIAAQLSLPVCVSPLLIERDLGILEGLTVAEALTRAGAETDDPFDPGYRPSGGESLLDVSRRAGTFLHQLVEESDGACVVVHAAWLRAAMLTDIRFLPVLDHGGSTHVNLLVV